MSRRDECLITTVGEATDWLDHYRHTITDPQVLLVIGLLESGASERVAEAEQEAENARSEAKDADDNLTEARERIESLLQQVDSLQEEVDDLVSRIDEGNR